MARRTTHHSGRHEFDEVTTERLNHVIYADEYDDLGAAFADVPAEGTHVHIPDKGSEYVISNPPIEVDRRVTVTGDGWTHEEGGFDGSVVRSPSDTPAFEQTTASPPSFTSRLVIEDVCFRGQGKGSGTATGLVFGEVRGLMLENVGAFEFGGDGIEVQTGLRAHLNKCHAKDNGESGVKFGDLNASRVQQLRAQNNGNAGLERTASSNLTVRDSTLEGNDQFGYLGTGSANTVIISECWLEANGTNNLKVAPGADPVTVLSLRGINSVANNPPSGAGIVIGDGGSGSINKAALLGVRSGGGGTVYDSMVTQVSEVATFHSSLTDNSGNRGALDARKLELTNDNVQVDITKPGFGDVRWQSFGNTAFGVQDDSDTTIFSIDERNGNVSTFAGRFSTGSVIPFFDGIQAEGGGSTYGNGVVKIGTNGARFEVNGSGEVVVFDEAGNETTLS
jgi:hypothetical protein